MKVCLVHEEYPLTSNFGGIATYEYNMAKLLSESGNEVTVICRAEENLNIMHVSKNWTIIPIYVEDYEPENIECVRRFQEKIAEKLLELQSLGKIDIVETPEWGANCLVFQRSSKRAIPIVVKLHTPLFVWEKYNHFLYNQMYRETMLKWEREQILNSDKLISCTKNLLQLVREGYKKSLFTASVIPNPLPVSQRNISPVYNKKIVSVMFVGSLEERKGVLTLAETLRKNKNLLLDYEFTFIGQDTDRNVEKRSTVTCMHERLDNSGLNIKFRGHLDHRYILNVMEEADVMVFPSLYDNLPYVILEALSIGRPVISSTRGGIPEIIHNGVDGYLVDPEKPDEFMKALNELRMTEERKRIGDNAIKNIARYYPENLKINILHNYEETIIKYKRGFLKHKA